MKHESNPRIPPGGELGTRYGGLTVQCVIKFGRKAEVECRCDCGRAHVSRIDSLKSSVAHGRSPSCKYCLSKLKAINGLNKFEPEKYIGKRYGRLLVTGIDVDLSRRNVKSRLVCLCDCGAQTVVTPMSLERRKTVSCGCFHKERLVEVAVETHTEHGHAGSTSDSNTPIYTAWLKIRSIVRDGWKKGFHRVCHEYDPRWEDFENFLSDFGAIKYHQTISRIDNQKPWSKENCFVNVGRRGVSPGYQSSERLAP